MLYPDMNLQKRTQQNTTRYRTALYLRLSREDGDKTESDSIANQRTLLEAYAADHPELCIVDEFVDDGYSGSNFERPAFQRLFRELEQGTINCVLVKDLSRFGRNYIEVGRYLERIFPVMRVRLIAVTDNYDSQSAWKTSDSIMVPMRNLLNDAYCRDISVKIKSQLAVKRKRGDFVGSFATYGYRKDPFTGKRKFHGGIDLHARGEQVLAMMEGVVVKGGQDKTSGKYVTLRHGNYTVSYCHLSRVLTAKGTVVRPRDAVGITGSTGRSTGEHLHITCKLNGKSVDPSVVFDYIRTTQQECISALSRLL